MSDTTIKIISLLSIPVTLLLLLSVVMPIWFALAIVAVAFIGILKVVIYLATGSTVGEWRWK